MDKRKTMIIASIMVVVAACVGYVLVTEDNNKGNQATTPQSQNSTQESKTPEAAASTEQPAASQLPSATDSAAAPGAYIDYQDGVIARTSGTKLLFFHAPWCPQCRSIDADIQKSGVPTNVTVIKVDYDSNQSLRQKYGVTLQTTVVKVDDAGNLVKKFVAYEEPTLAAITRELL